MRSVRRLGGVVLALAVLLGCSKEESSTGPSTSANYFPLKVGNWWVYSRVELDTNGNVVAGTETRDSMVIVRQTQLGGKTAFVAVTYSGGSMSGDTTYMSTEGGKLYIYVQPSPQPDSPFELLSGWVVWIDPTQAQWTSAQVRDTLENVELFDQRGSLRLQVTLQGSRGGAASVTITEKNQTVQAQEFVNTFRLEGTFVPEGQQISIPVQATFTFRQWFAADIGQVKSRNEPWTVTVQPPPPLPPVQQKTGGEQSVLVNYRVQ